MLGAAPMSNGRRYHELEQAIDGVLATYDSEDPINSLDTAALPNKRAVIDAYTHLEPALFMGFYSQRPLEGTTSATGSPSTSTRPTISSSIRSIARSATTSGMVARPRAAPSAPRRRWCSR